jgi:hypothetical protein
MDNPKIEVLPSLEDMLRGPLRHDQLLKIVQVEVAKTMAERDALAFEPFFRSRQVAYELKRLQTVPEQRKWSIWYERYGCLDCKSQDDPHAGNGLCSICRGKVFRRLAQIIAEGIKGEPAQRAAGAPSSKRVLPKNAARDGVHHTWYKPRKLTCPTCGQWCGGRLLRQGQKV